MSHLQNCSLKTYFKRALEGGGGRVGCERRIKFFVKIQKTIYFLFFIFFFFFGGGGGVGGGGVGQVGWDQVGCERKADMRLCITPMQNTVF